MIIRHILITRPLQEALEIQPIIEKLGYKVTIEPLLEIISHPYHINNIDQYHGLIFTSRHAIEAYSSANTQRDINIYVVGPQTYKIAAQHGFNNIHSADGNVESLEKLLQRQKTTMPYLYIQGKNISRPLSKNIKHSSAAMYEAKKVPSIPQCTLDMIAEGKFSDISFFSVRTAQNFVEILKRTDQTQNTPQNALQNTKALCLSHSMVEFVDILPWQSVEVTPSPDREGFLSLLMQNTSNKT